MPGFSSLDDLISEMTVNGKIKRTDWNKATHAVGNQAAGIWYALAHSLGNPTAWVPGVVGTNLAWHGLSDRSTGAILHGGDVSTDTKHIVNASIFGAGVAPSVWMLVDMLGWYPVSTVTATGDQALVNSKTFSATAATPTVLTVAAGWDVQEGTCIRLTTTTTLPAGLSLATNYFWHRLSATTGNVSTTRANLDAGTYVAASDTGTGTHTATMYLDRYGDGKGVQAFITPSAALNTGVPNIQLTYTNTTPTTGRITPTTLPISNASAPIGQIEYSGTAAGKYGPFVPLAAGDQGIVSVQQFNYNVTHGAGGVTNLVLCKPLLTLPITTASVVTERDLLNQVPSLPQVKDGAYLAWIMMAGGATVAASQFYGAIDFAWG